MTTRKPAPQPGKRTPGQAQRAPIEQVMELKFPNFELLVTAISANISTTGMFIQTADPAPVGTTLSFRFRIEDWNPIQGTARVVWNRHTDEAPDRPAGMGVKFVDADAQSRRMIRYLVDKHSEKGGAPFELGPAADVPADHPSLRPPTTRSSPDGEPTGNRWLWTVAALLMVGVVGFGLWFQSRQPSSNDDSEPRAVAERQEVDVSSTPAVSPVDETSDATEVPGHWQAEEEIERLVRDWSAAWESGKPGVLLSFYAADFEPAGRESRAQWEARIERELSSSSYIRVAISALEISAPSAASGQATFFRSVRSDQRDETVKTAFEVERTEGGWKITRQIDSR